MIIYEVTLEQEILLPGRTKPDNIDRVFKVEAASRQSAARQVKGAGYKGIITKVKPIIASRFE